ncbi:MAG TPA: LLM class flavin-dependent oxidoreductase [Caldilineaceae bacterium]|nr:LLM class flavin-dependent oxidoreductase [Caldilineaceae bacterium]
MGDLKFGWHLPSFPVDGSSGPQFVDQIANALERIQDDVDSIWMDDHFVPWANWQAPETPYLEGVSTMAYLAGAFPRIKIGSSVFCQSYRNPALLAKTAATLQLLSRGRLLFGIGAGWLEREYRQYGYDFPSPAVRIAQLEEAVQIVKLLWTQGRATFHGKYYHIEDAICEPKPDPLPPILIGGGGEQLTLRVVAKYADWWNLSGGSLETYAHKLEVLRGHCETVGRDFNAILKTWSAEAVAVAESEAEAKRIAAESPYDNHPIVGAPDQVAAQLQPFLDLGVEYLIVRMLDFPRTEGLELFAREVMPRLARP